MKTKILLTFILVFALAGLVSAECTSNYRSYCYHGNVDWEDSCGKYERTEICSYGCSDGKCLGKGGSSTCGDNKCTFNDFESVYVGQDETGQAKFEACFEDCRSDITNPLDFIVTYYQYYNSKGERTPGKDYFSLDIWNEGPSAVDMSTVSFVVGGINRGVAQYQNFGYGSINSGERKPFTINTSLSGSISDDLCGKEFSFALRKKETSELYSFDGGKFLNCININEVVPTTIEEPIPMPENKANLIYLCGGCELEDKCYSFGFRKSGNFCSDENNQFIEQKKEDFTCENNFECSSNVCVSGKCISESFIQKIINWFKNLFG